MISYYRDFYTESTDEKLESLYKDLSSMMLAFGEDTGGIDFQRFIVAMAIVGSYDSSKEHLLFLSFDRNWDGRIGQTDLVEGLRVSSIILVIELRSISLVYVIY